MGYIAATTERRRFPRPAGCFRAMVVRPHHVAPFPRPVWSWHCQPSVSAGVGREPLSELRYGAVVTAYFPTESLQTLVHLLAGECDRVVIVDNTPGGSDACKQLGSDRVRVLSMGQNVGLGSALNAGIGALRDDGVEAFGLWDQDSVPSRGYMARLAGELAMHEAWPLVIGAGRHGQPTWQSTRQSTSESPSDLSLKPALRLITSGMFFPAAVFDAIGPFRQDFFVDMIDTEYSLRARAKGVRLLKTDGLLINHGFGNLERSTRAFGFRSSTSGHPVWRQYWIARNATIILRDFRRNDRVGTAKIRRETLHWYARALMGGPDRLATALAALRGFRDGRRHSVDSRYVPAHARVPTDTAA